jgi:hypothetical protein
MMARLPIIIFGFVVMSCAYAEEPPPRAPFDSVDWPALSTAKVTTGLKMGTFAVTYEKTTLGEIRNKIGTGQIKHHGDAAESTYWLCYSTKKERIWILSGEMGGSENAVLNVVIEDGEFKKNQDCPALPSNYQPVSFINGLWVSATEDAVLKILGRPSHTKGQWLSFDYLGKEMSFCKPSGADVMNWVVLKVINGRVVAIHAGQVTSC